MKHPRRRTRSILCAGVAAMLALAAAGCDEETRGIVGPDEEVADNLQASPQFPNIFLPAGFRIEKVVEGLTFPTALTFDDQGQMYVAEAGGAFLEEPPPARIMRIENGTATQFVNLEPFVTASVVGLTFYNGAFYISHRDKQDRTGAVSRVTMDGQVTKILTGVMDSQAEHQVNDIKVGPDGRMFLATGPAGNAAVVGLDIAPFVALSPNLHTTPCQDIVLNGVNYRTPDFRSRVDASDVTETGAFVPFGTATTPGQRIPGTKKCGGSILVFDPNNAEATVRPFVSGLRNAVGLAFRGNEMFVTVNGYDVRGSRPFNDNVDPTYRVVEGRFYGYPDFSLGTFESISDPKFDVPNSLQAPQFINGQPQGKDPQLPVIDLAASGLQRPDRSLVAALHPINSSPSGIDASPASFGSFGNQLFIAEWGDLAPPTTPLRNLPVGSRIVRINPGSDRPEAFVRNRMRGPASEQGAAGMALERPFYVKFGPDGAMYIVDYGVSRPNRPGSSPGPYEFVPRTGIIWKVSRSGS